MLVQAANWTKETFAAVTTRTIYAPLWLQDQNSQSLRWRDGIVMSRQVKGIVFALSLALRMEIRFFKDFLENKQLPYFKTISASSKL